MVARRQGEVVQAKEAVTLHASERCAIEVPMVVRASLIGAICLTAPICALAQTAPPRTIADITAILNREKPDPQVLARKRAAAQAQPPDGLSPADLAKFYYDRG